MSTLPSGSSAALVVASGCRMVPTFLHRGLASVKSMLSTVPVCSPLSFCPEIMNHLCDLVCPSRSISNWLAVGQQYGLTSAAVFSSVQWFFAGTSRLGCFSAPSTSRHHVVPLVMVGYLPLTPTLAA